MRLTSAVVRVLESIRRRAPDTAKPDICIGRAGAAIAVALLACVSAIPARAYGEENEPFGISGFSMETTQASMVDKTRNEPMFFDQAAGHPIALTTSVRFATEEIGTNHTLIPTRDPKDVIIDLPPGLIANPQAVPRCTLGLSENCPTDTQVGVFVLHASGLGGSKGLTGPIVNLTPGPGDSAKLGLETPFLTLPLIGHLVRTADGYTSSIATSGLPEVGVTSMEITLWGVPAAAVHDPLRGASCARNLSGSESCPEPGVHSSGEPAAFLTMPSSCSEIPKAIAWADSWVEPGRFLEAEATLPQMTNCERLPFTPRFNVRPETLNAAKPAGVDVNMDVPQLGSEAIVSTPSLQDATITLPQGVSINAGVANGLQACDATGPTGINIPTGLAANGEPLQPSEPGPGEELGPEGTPQLAPGSCPGASIVGKVEASTPLLAHPIEGRVFIATPGCGGQGQAICSERDAVDGNLYRLYIELGGKASERNEGALIKLQATVVANPATGQLTVRLTNMPQLPISELDIRLFGGEHALLANPTTCGTATSTAVLEPWSAPLTPVAAPSSYYTVTGCTNPPTLNPGLLTGSLNTAAGAFTPFALTITRKDNEQNLTALEVHTPRGLSAMLASVPLCPTSLASIGGCPAVSRVGGSQVAIGAGSQPLYLPGDVYLTSGYEGAPFGLSVVTDAHAGPLNLGRLVIRARINIDPQTAALTIATDPLPQIVLGVPLRIQRISLTLDRSRFIVNPTGCDEQPITATITGTLNTLAAVSNRFALANCRNLAFKPKITASTNAHTSLSGGASLDVRVTLPNTEQGTQANLRRIKVTLPQQLPPRLSSLQHSCLQRTFAQNPSVCPNTSIIGIARARTQVLPGELVGPVYLVTRGRGAFPSPTVALQDNGVTLELVGSTKISKTGVATVAFDETPDVPLRNLELYLPAGPHSLLGANANLCTPGKISTAKRIVTRPARARGTHHAVKLRKRLPATLPMTTELAAHNGTVVHQTTKIQVVGCGAKSDRATNRLAF